LTSTGAELLRHDALQKGNILADELFLQADGVRRDDDAMILVGDGGEDGRHEVGEGLAHASAGLDHEMLLVGEGIGNGVGHFELLGRVS